jgi:hypothetical protein
MVIEVVARSTPYAVRLATTRTPGGEDEATVPAGATVQLHSRDVAWGETIDSRLEYTALDGSGTTFVDELTDWSFTRPSEQDCATAAAPATATIPAPSAGADGPQQSGTAGPAWNTGHATVQSHPRAGTFAVRGSGFQPGERVTARLRDEEAIVGSAVAGPDGSVRIEIELPGRTPGGAAVDLVGDRSQVTAGVRLESGALQTPVDPAGTGNLAALIAAAVALVGTVAALVAVAGRQRAVGRSGARFRSA